MTKNIVGYENIHQHSDFSLLDGYGKVDEYAERAVKINQQFVCITDHGMMGVIPQQIRACETYKRFPVYGVELYVNDKHENKDTINLLDIEQKKIFRKSYHLLAIAYSDEGYKNLVNLCSWAWQNGFYYKPRVNHKQLLSRKEGIIFTTGCYNSEVGQAFDRGGDEQANQMLEKYIEMFSPNLYLEFMLLDFVKQKPYNAYIMRAHEKYKLPLVLSNDCHYCRKEDSKHQRYMLMVQKKSTLAEINQRLSTEDQQEIFELQDENLWMKSEEEINEKWLQMYSDVIPLELFEQAKKNSVEICRKAKGLQLDRSVKLPEVQDADLKLKEALIAGFKWRGLQDKGKEYAYRLKEEYELIKRKGFSSYFLIQKNLVDEARRVCPEMIGYGDGNEACGVGRGSAVGSLATFCLSITNVDPIAHGLLFSRFMNEARGGKSLNIRFNRSPINT